MKKISILLIAILFLFFVSGCSEAAVPENNMEVSGEETVDTLSSNIQAQKDTLRELKEEYGGDFCGVDLSGVNYIVINSEKVVIYNSLFGSAKVINRALITETSQIMGVIEIKTSRPNDTISLAFDTNTAQIIMDCLS